MKRSKKATDSCVRSMNGGSEENSPNEARKSGSSRPCSSVAYVLKALKDGVRVLPSVNQKPPFAVSSSERFH